MSCSKQNPHSHFSHDKPPPIRASDGPFTFLNPTRRYHVVSPPRSGGDSVVVVVPTSVQEDPHNVSCCCTTSAPPTFITTTTSTSTGLVSHGASSGGFSTSTSQLSQIISSTPDVTGGTQTALTGPHVQDQEVQGLLLVAQEVDKTTKGPEQSAANVRHVPNAGLLLPLPAKDADGDQPGGLFNGRSVTVEKGKDGQRGHGHGTKDGEGGGNSRDVQNGGEGNETGDDARGIYHVWRSRDNRKGRHLVAVVTTRKPSAGIKRCPRETKGIHHTAAGDNGARDGTRNAAVHASRTAQRARETGTTGTAGVDGDIVDTDTDNVVGKEGTDDSRGGGGGRGDVRIPSATNTLEQTLRGIARMIMRYPVWDVSYDVAIIFTLGSAVWVINGCFVWLPLAAPWTEFPTEYDLGGGVTAFIGATIFEIGSVLLMLEAVNENRSDCFGWALEEALSHESHSLHLIIKNECKHHHHDRHSFLRRDTSPTPSTSTVTDEENGKPDHAISGSGGRRWSWFPTRHELTTHYLRDIGFLACLSQMIGATIFWIAGFTGLPPIYAPLSTPVANGVYWLPQVVGGSGFIISSILFMVETQDKWWKPAPKMLGWHIGFWNLTGALGFTLCGALGFAIEQGSVQYAATLSTFVGSWAFLIGSLIQWYESLDKYPILVLDKVPGELEKLLGGSSESIA